LISNHHCSNSALQQNCEESYRGSRFGSPRNFFPNSSLHRYLDRTYTRLYIYRCRVSHQFTSVRDATYNRSCPVQAIPVLGQFEIRRVPLLSSPAVLCIVLRDNSSSGLPVSFSWLRIMAHAIIFLPRFWSFVTYVFESYQFLRPNYASTADATFGTPHNTSW